MDENFLPITTPMASYHEERAKIHQKLTEHMLFKKRAAEENIKREELERAIQDEVWPYAMQLCKEILDMRAFNFEPLYHFYCAFIYEQGYHNYESSEKHYKIALQIEGENEKYIRYYARIVRRLERYFFFFIYSSHFIHYFSWDIDLFHVSVSCVYGCEMIEIFCLFWFCYYYC